MRKISEVAVILPKLRGESAKRRKELIFKKETAKFGEKSSSCVVQNNRIYHIYNESAQETFIRKGDSQLHLSTNKNRKHIEVW